MKILVAPDKFKGSLTAKEVCHAVEEGLLRLFPEMEIIKAPLADGGEGTSELLIESFKGRMIKPDVADPLFNTIPSEYGINEDGTIALIEMAKASGLQLLTKENQNPLYTTTLGTGELIRDAIDKGAKKIILGIGGSATNDAGMGVAEALGYEFYDKNGNRLKPIGENLIHIETISTHHVHPQLKDIEFIALCDVENPLYGTSGAAFVYGPQKGADFKIAKALDDGLRHFEKVIAKTFHTAANFPGAGAGGGIASGAKVFLNARMQKGIDFLMETIGLEEKIKTSDLVITGEGKVDLQTLSGKVVASVTRLAQKNHKPVVVLCGICELRTHELEKIGIRHILSLADPFTDIEQAIASAHDLIIKRIAENQSFFAIKK